MSPTLTARGKILQGAMRRNLELLDELDKTAPGDVDQIVAGLVQHLRSWKPMALSGFDTSPFGKVAP